MKRYQHTQSVVHKQKIVQGALFHLKSQKAFINAWWIVCP